MVPHRSELLFRIRGCLAWPAAATVGGNRRDAREWRRASCGSMLAAFDHQETAERSQHHAATLRLALPDAGERALPEQLSHLIMQYYVGSLRVVGPSDQEQLALVRGDACAGDANSVGARRFLAHERARRTHHAVHDRDVAR